MRVADFKFLGVTIKEDLICNANTSILAKKVQQRLFYPWLLRKPRFSKKLLVDVY